MMIIKPLPGAQIDWLHPQVQGQVLNLLCNEGTGNQLWDYSLKGNKGTLYGPAWVPGRDGWALSFNGSSDYVNTSYAPNFAVGQSFSMGGWFKTTTTAAYYSMGSIADRGVDPRIIIGINGVQVGQYFAQIMGNDGVNLNTGIHSGPDGNDWLWHHVFMVRDVVEDKLKLYQDGREVASVTDTTGGGFNLSGYPLYVGAVNLRGADFGHFPGNISVVKFYTRALDTAKVEQLYTNPYTMFEWPEPTKFYAAPSDIFTDMWHPKTEQPHFDEVRVVGY